MNIFNVRVYGLMINESKEILLCNESYKGIQFTKFPGGGLEFGEGLLDCLKREFIEETGIEVEIESHFYTTDFFQASVFNPKHQLISIYYKVKSQGFSIPEYSEGSPFFFWKSMRELTSEEVTFPVDRLVVEKLLKMQTMDNQ